jgi:hypothetical protein
MVATVLSAGIVLAARRQPASVDPVPDFIDTSIENGSPLWYDVVDGVVRIHLIYDHERASPNRAAGHIHFLITGAQAARSRWSS